MLKKDDIFDKHKAEREGKTTSFRAGNDGVCLLVA